MSGRSVSGDLSRIGGGSSLSASVFLVPGAEEGPFQEEGTLLLDETQSQTGTVYLLYTHYSKQGKPEVKTKRLVFDGQAKCAELNLPCATNQPELSIRTDQRVRVSGTVKNDLVLVHEIYRL
ncbi:MAG: hypothetical protein Q8K68_13870 [Nitrospirota bacterium]|nr:hypothetical protein [Nitrospirota bacterium]